MAGRCADQAAVRKGVAYLERRQLESGDWPQEASPASSTRRRSRPAAAGRVPSGPWRATGRCFVVAAFIVNYRALNSPSSRGAGVQAPRGGFFALRSRAFAAHSMAMALRSPLSLLTRAARFLTCGADFYACPSAGASPSGAALHEAGGLLLFLFVVPSSV